MKTCKNCGETRSEDEFYHNPTAANGGNVCKHCKRITDAAYRERHRERLRAEMSEWRRANQDRLNEANRARARALREEVLAAYGGACSCCGESTYEFLTLDHIDGNGGEHRKATNRKVYADLKRRGFPEGHRILCWNCNCAHGRYGYCPHEKEIAA